MIAACVWAGNASKRMVVQLFGGLENYEHVTKEIIHVKNKYPFVPTNYVSHANGWRAIGHYKNKVVAVCAETYEFLANPEKYEQFFALGVTLNRNMRSSTRSKDGELRDAGAWKSGKPMFAMHNLAAEGLEELVEKLAKYETFAVCIPSSAVCPGVVAGLYPNSFEFELVEKKTEWELKPMCEMPTAMCLVEELCSPERQMYAFIAAILCYTGEYMMCKEATSDWSCITTKLNKSLGDIPILSYFKAKKLGMLPFNFTLSRSPDDEDVRNAYWFHVSQILFIPVCMMVLSEMSGIIESVREHFGNSGVAILKHFNELVKIDSGCFTMKASKEQLEKLYKFGKQKTTLTGKYTPKNKQVWEEMLIDLFGVKHFMDVIDGGVFEPPIFSKSGGGQWLANFLSGPGFSYAGSSLLSESCAKKLTVVDFFNMCISSCSGIFEQQKKHMISFKKFLPELTDEDMMTLNYSAPYMTIEGKEEDLLMFNGVNTGIKHTNLELKLTCMELDENETPVPVTEPFMLMHQKVDQTIKAVLDMKVAGKKHRKSDESEDENENEGEGEDEDENEGEDADADEDEDADADEDEDEDADTDEDEDEDEDSDAD